MTSVESLARAGLPCADIKDRLETLPVRGETSLQSLIRAVALKIPPTLVKALLHVYWAAFLREGDRETVLSVLAKVPVREQPGVARGVTLWSLSTFLGCSPAIAKSRASRQQLVDAVINHLHHGHSGPAGNITRGEGFTDPTKNGVDSNSAQAVSVQSLAALLQAGRPCPDLKEKLNKLPARGQPSLLSLVRTVRAPVTSESACKSDLVLALLHGDRETVLSELAKVPVREQPSVARGVTLWSLSTFLGCSPEIAKTRACRQQLVDALINHQTGDKGISESVQKSLRVLVEDIRTFRSAHGGSLPPRTHRRHSAGSTDEDKLAQSWGRLLQRKAAAGTGKGLRPADIQYVEEALGRDIWGQRQPLEEYKSRSWLFSSLFLYITITLIEFPVFRSDATHPISES